MSFLRKVIEMLTPHETRKLTQARIELDSEQEKAWRLFRSDMEQESQALSKAIHEAQQKKKKK